MEKILIIDDDEDLCELVGEYLQVEGFDTATANDGEEGLKMALEGGYDLITLDVMLPKKNGFDVLRELRQQSAAPVLMLTARGDDMERIVGLEIGADDYLPKPFNPRELVARIRAILRRVENGSQDPDSDKFVVGDLEISRAGRSASVAGEKLQLTAIEFDLLADLAENAGKVVEKEDLSVRILDRELSPFDRSLDMHVSNLRKKLGNRPDGESRIKTIRSVGYIYTIAD
ncbi:MAG: response regulator transcription factor [Pyrinomonadaceae bacterium]